MIIQVHSNMSRIWQDQAESQVRVKARKDLEDLRRNLQYALETLPL